MGAASAKEDLLEYQLGYPNTSGLDNPRKTLNLRFYKNEIRSESTGRPRGDFVENIHEKWWGKYDLLEEHHGYIQWLFPIHEQGLNSFVHPLQRHESKAIRENEECRERLIRSYELMLDFYGMVLDRKTGKVSRSKNFRPRYDNLNRCFHNYLRITRILKCLGEMGLEQWKLPFLLHVGSEILHHGELRNAKDSLLRYWAPTLRLKDEREEMQRRIDNAIAEQKAAEERRIKERRRRIEVSKEQLKTDPSGAVGERVSVKWNIKSRYYPYERVSRWYEGVIQSYDRKENSHMHHVLYDDGDDRIYENMAEKKDFFFLNQDKIPSATTMAGDKDDVKEKTRPSDVEPGEPIVADVAEDERST